jgi:hypothetical protein
MSWRKRSCPGLRYCPNICLKGRKKPIGSQDSRCPIQDSNRALTEYRLKMLLLEPLCTMTSIFVLVSTHFSQLYKHGLRYKHISVTKNIRMNLNMIQTEEILAFLEWISTIFSSGFFHVNVMELLISICVLMFERRRLLVTDFSCCPH